LVSNKKIPEHILTSIPNDIKTMNTMLDLFDFQIKELAESLAIAARQLSADIIYEIDAHCREEEIGHRLN